MQMDISNDAWIRTTQKDHERLVCSFLQRVKDAGDIYKDSYEGHYCVGCEKYLDAEEMDEHKACRTHKTPCELRREENWFFRLSRRVYNPLEQLSSIVVQNVRHFCSMSDCQ